MNSRQTARRSKLRHRKASNSESQAPHKHPSYPSFCSQIMALNRSQGRLLQKVLDEQWVNETYSTDRKLNSTKNIVTIFWFRAWKWSRLARQVLCVFFYQDNFKHLTDRKRDEWTTQKGKNVAENQQTTTKSKVPPRGQQREKNILALSILRSFPQYYFHFATKLDEALEQKRERVEM